MRLAALELQRGRRPARVVEVPSLGRRFRKRPLGCYGIRGEGSIPVALPPPQDSDKSPSPRRTAQRQAMMPLRFYLPGRIERHGYSPARSSTQWKSAPRTA
jgi:hypothetical protein